MKSLVKCFLIVQLLTFTSLGNASVITGDISSDFYEGIIEFEPVLPEIKGNTIRQIKQSCIGLCFDLGSLFSGPPEKQNQQEYDALKNSYFFLSGDPDDLAFHYLNFVCVEGKVVMMNFISHKFVVFKGEYSVQGMLLASHEIISSVLPNIVPGLVQEFPVYPGGEDRIRGASYVDYVCTQGFRNRYEKYNLKSIGPRYGEYFYLKFKKGRVIIQWDTSKWIDEVEAGAQSLLQEVKEKMENHGVYLPALN
ncbi:MAG: hypothetical protein KDD50_03040 [Bdellovibrionales bacterium]|nr:hypothetical protein [Bdellovibrionales bacterium]